MEETFGVKAVSTFSRTYLKVKEIEDENSKSFFQVRKKMKEIGNW